MRKSEIKKEIKKTERYIKESEEDYLNMFFERIIIYFEILVDSN
jgi:hypothetical protein